MIKNKELIERFLRYVKIDTKSDEDSGCVPSTAKQHDLARLLDKELREMEKQMDVMKQYMEKQGIRTKEAARSGKKKDGQER